MSIFDKDVDYITSQDLAELLADSAVENVRLEFKREVPAKDETLKKLSSFANTYGGIIIVGAMAHSSDGKLIALPGVDLENGYKQRLVQWCFEGMWPPLEPYISPPILSPSDATKVCYVISVPESREAPHFLNGRKGAWIRTNEFSQRFEPRLVTYSELEHLRERRVLLVKIREKAVERAFARFQTCLASSQPSSYGTKGRPRAIMFLTASPMFPSRQLVTDNELEDLVVSYRLNWRDVGFPRISNKITQKDSVLLLNAAADFSLFEATSFGQLFYARDISEIQKADNSSSTEHWIHLHSFLGHLLVFLKHAGGLLERLGYRGSVLLRMRLIGIRNISFVRYNDYSRGSSSASPLDDNIEFELSVSTQQLLSNSDNVAKNFARMLFFSINWSSVARNEKDVDQLVRDGYKYNFWDNTN